MKIFEQIKQRLEERRIKIEAIKNILLTLNKLPMNDIKNKVTNVAGLLLLVCGGIISVATAGVALPATVVTIATVGASISGSVLAFFTGKNPDGTKKTDEQIQAALNPSDKK